MRSLTGLFLLLAGIAVGAQAYYPDTVEKHVHIAQLARVLTPASSYDTTSHQLQAEAGRTFSPARPLLATEDAYEAHRVKTVEQRATPILNNAPKLVRANGWDANVIRTAATLDSPNRPLSDAERWRLVRDLQAELRRAGCYWGKLDGSWGAGSKYALQEFMLKVNASLPTDVPDPIMLTLVRSHEGTVCGKGCEDGYTKSANGRCLPYAITAEKLPEPPVPQVVSPPARLVRSGTLDGGLAAATVVSEPARQYPEGRMAVGGPVNEINPRYTASSITAAPRPDPYVRPDYRASSKTRKAATSRKTRPSYRSASSKQQRRKALIRKAFGEDF